MTFGATITPQEVLDTYFLETRAKLLEIAATLDRVDRAGGVEAGDARMGFIREALKVLESVERGGGRAERIQRLYSKE
jgi:hypothetical protein